MSITGVRRGSGSRNYGRKICRLQVCCFVRKDFGMVLSARDALVKVNGVNDVNG